MGKMKKTELKMKLVSAAFIVLMLGSIFAGVASAVDTNNANENKNLNIIDRIISIIKSIFSGADSDDKVKVELIRSFSDEKEFEKYMGIGEPKEEQVVILSEAPRQAWSMKEIGFYDPEGNLLSTFSCEWCSVSQSRNGEYIGVLEFNEEFTQLKFTLLYQSGQVLWHKDDFHPTTYGSMCEVVISNDGKGIISFTLQDINVPYSILFHDSKGDVIKGYYEGKDREKFDFYMAVSKLSPDGEYFIVAGPDGIFAFDWKGELIWKRYEFSPIYMRVAHEIHISPDGKYVVVKVDEHPTEEEMEVCLYFLDRNGKFIGRYSKEYLHGWNRFSEDGKSFLIATHTSLFLFDPNNAKKLWSYQFDKGCVYIPSLDLSPDGEWIVLVRAFSETDKTMYLFNNLGERVLAKKFEGDDLGDIIQPTVDFVGDSNKLSVKFPNKILLFEVIKEEAKE